MYHGTTPPSAKILVEGGWSPFDSKTNPNGGSGRYLYLTSDPKDAEWFARQNGSDIVLEVSEIPLNFLLPDPEDEAGFTFEELFVRLLNRRLPSKFVLNKPLSFSHFSYYENTL